MLTHLRLSNFKRFESVDVALQPFTILMGENGSGKTSLLQAIALGMRIFATTDMIRWDASAGRARIPDRGVPYTQLPGLALEDPADIYFAKTPRGGQRGGVTPIKIDLTDSTGGLYRVEIQSLFGAFNAKCVSTVADVPAPPVTIEASPLFISGFVGIPTAEERFFPVAIEDRLVRGRASEVIRNLLLDIHETDPTRFERLRTKVKSNFNFEIGKVSFSGDQDLHVHANYQERIRNRTLSLDLSTAGSGFLQVLQMLAPIYRVAGKARVVLLDEPDAHLHPNLQRTTARVLREIAEEERLQVIISTHSTAIIREVPPNAVVPVSSQRPHLTGLGSAEELEGEIALRLDNFTAAKARLAGKLLFVEDKSVSILESVDNAAGTGVFEGPSAVPVLSAQGKDDRVPFRIRKTLKEIAGEDITVLFMRDGDGLPDEWRAKLTEHAEKSGIELILLDRHEVESYPIEPSLIARALQDLGVVLDESEIEADFVSIMRDVIRLGQFEFDKTLRDTIYKTARLLNEDVSFGDAEKLASRLRNSYGELMSFAELRAVAPGKEALGQLLALYKQRHGVQLTYARLIGALRSEDVDPALLGTLTAVVGAEPGKPQRSGRGAAHSVRKRVPPPAPVRKAGEAKKRGPIELMRELISEGWFSEPRTTANIVAELASRGAKHRGQDLTRQLLALTSNGEIQRQKRKRNGGQAVWHYFQGARLGNSRTA